MSTALQQNAATLANILMQRRQFQAQQQERQQQLAQQERTNRLSDLQYNRLQREDQYQTGLQSAMANPQSTSTVSIAQQPQRLPQLSLASLGHQVQPQQFQPTGLAPASPTVQAYNEGRIKTDAVRQTPGQAGAQYAMLQGNFADAAKLLTLDDAFIQKQAQGDPVKYAQAKQELEQGAKFFEVIKPYAKNPAALKQVWPQVQQMFPQQTVGITPDSIISQGNSVIMPLEMNGQIVPGKATYSDDDGKMHIIDIAAKADPEAMLDKRFANQQVIQDRQFANQQKLTQQQIEAADRRANAAAVAKDRAPGKILPAGQLESIADMKRVKDVLAEAASDMATNKVSTGPVAGRLQALGAKVGAADDTFVNVQQKLQTAQNIMLKLRSGAAVTESEFARFLKEYPTPNDPPEVFNRKMQNTINYASTLMDGKLDIYEEGGYKVPKSAKSGGKPAPAKGKAPVVTKGGFKVTVVP